MHSDPERPSSERPKLEAVQADVQGRLGASLRRLRAEKSWGQEEAAYQAHVGMRAYQRLEAGKSANPTLNTLVRLALAFDVDVRELLVPAEAPAKRRPGRPRRVAEEKHADEPERASPPSAR